MQYPGMVVIPVVQCIKDANPTRDNESAALLSQNPAGRTVSLLNEESARTRGMLDVDG